MILFFVSSINFSLFFIVFFNTYQGVREVDPVLVDNARMLGASERQLTTHVLAPSALTWIFSSLHVSIGFAKIEPVGGYLPQDEFDRQLKIIDRAIQVVVSDIEFRENGLRRELATVPQPGDRLPVLGRV